MLPLTLLLLFLLPSSSKAQNPDSPYCGISASHSLCQFRGPNPRCYGGSAFASGLDAADRDLIVSLHNGVRSRVASGHHPPQPAGSNMRRLHWDDELAAAAQRWADQCVRPAGRDANRDVRRFAVGQNVYEADTVFAAEAIREAVMGLRGWLGEGRRFPGGTELDSYRYWRDFPTKLITFADALTCLRIITVRSGPLRKLILSHLAQAGELIKEMRIYSEEYVRISSCVIPHAGPFRRRRSTRSWCGRRRTALAAAAPPTAATSASRRSSCAITAPPATRPAAPSTCAPAPARTARSERGARKNYPESAPVSEEAISRDLRQPRSYLQRPRVLRCRKTTSSFRGSFVRPPQRRRSRRRGERRRPR